MIAENKKIIYFGLDALIGCLHLIKQRGLEVVKIFTFPDDGYDKTEALSAFARDNNIPISYVKPTEDEIRELYDGGVGLMIVGGYPWKIPVIENMYQVNIHPSVLPIGRGPWPMPVSILRGMDSGVTLHKLVDKIDEGDIILQEIIPYDSKNNLVMLTEKIAAAARRLIDTFLSDVEGLLENAQPQSDGEYWLEPNESERSFELTDSTEKIDRILKAFYGYEALTEIYGVPIRIIEGAISDTEDPDYPSVPVGDGYLICKRWDYSFREIRLSDMEKIEGIRKRYAPRLSDYTYSMLYCWQKELDLSIYVDDDMYVVKAENEFLFPIGERSKAIAFIEGLLKLDGCVKLRFCDEEMKSVVSEHFGTRAVSRLEESDCDYVISHKSMGSLAGKTLSKRRTEYNGFLRKHKNIKIDLIDRNNIDRVKSLAQNHKCEYIEAESRGIESYFELGLIGVIVSSDGEDIGFAICSRKDEDTLQGHFLRNVCVDHSSMFYLLKLSMDYFSDQYSFTNIEDDMGNEGLRFFKKSIDPEIISSYSITIKQKDNLL